MEAHMKNDCQVYRELMASQEWLDDKEKNMLAEHLQTCPRCTHDLELITDLAEALSPETLPTPEGDLTARIMAGVSQDTVQARTPWLTAGLLLFLSGQVLLLVILRTQADPIWSQLGSLGEWFWSGLLAPLVSALQASLGGLFQMPSIPELPDLTALWLTGAAALIVLGLFIGVIFHATEERNHA